MKTITMKNIIYFLFFLIVLPANAQSVHSKKIESKREGFCFYETIWSKYK